MTPTNDLLVLAFREVDDDEWREARRRTEQFFRDRLDTYPNGTLKGEVSTRNIGRGADWMVIAISITSAIATAFVAIPKAHKLIRESVEEWLRIYRELKSLYTWICADRNAFYPDPYLFLVALAHIDKELGTQEVAFLGVMRLPEDNPDLQGKEALLFSFKAKGVIEQIAVSRGGEVLWQNAFATEGDVE